MKKVLFWIRAIAANLTLIFSVIILVFLVLDQYNPVMNFMNNGGTTVFLWILCCSALVTALCSVLRK